MHLPNLSALSALSAASALLTRRTALLMGTLAAPMASHALPAKTLMFPRDHGSHPDFRTEWWYVTGAVQAGERAFGFQVTFFRSRVEATQGMQSKFAAKQLVFAHAAITDVQGKQLLHDQRIAREGFDVVQAGTADTHVKLKDWSIARQSSGLYKALASGPDFKIDLQLQPTQALLLQGDKGLSRKGPQASQASYYYSQPQLAATGTLTLRGKPLAVQGKAWLDHEWSQALMHPQATGWDWIGINLLDGSSLTAFQLRDATGKALWDGGSFRSASGVVYPFSRGEVLFKKQRQWKSSKSQTTYPVEWMVRTPADYYTVRALVDNQELDSRASTGAIYWEGLCELIDSNSRIVGRGYLEMTGYAKPLRL
jgi:predicted secreted hydrolase